MAGSRVLNPRPAKEPGTQDAARRTQDLGKREIRVVRIPRWITVLLWLVVSAAMATAIYFLSGHAYHRESSFADIVTMLRRYDRGSATSAVILAIIAPAIADMRFFLPWGLSRSLSLDGPNRSRKSIYGVTIVLGVAFALALIAWQEMLATRVTSWFDAFWNTLGFAGGAALGHARKRVRLRFE